MIGWLEFTHHWLFSEEQYNKNKMDILFVEHTMEIRYMYKIKFMKKTYYFLTYVYTYRIIESNVGGMYIGNDKGVYDIWKLIRTSCVYNLVTSSIT